MFDGRGELVEVEATGKIWVKNDKREVVGNAVGFVGNLI
jgi:hypothetical protein